MHYITIEREYGSGGTTIARKLSEETGIPYYGHDILSAAAKRKHLPEDQAEQHEEAANNSFLYSLYMLSKSMEGKIDMSTLEDNIFLEEQRVIQNFANQGSAIFIGHCAESALEAYHNVITVFIWGDVEDKRKRIQKDYKITPEKINQTMHRFDRKRATYYQSNTGKKWDDHRSYDIVLSSSDLGIDRCVHVLKSLIDFKK